MALKSKLAHLISAINSGIKTKRFKIQVNNFYYANSFLNVLRRSGYIYGFSYNKEKITVFLKYYKNKPIIQQLVLISSSTSKRYHPVKSLQFNSIYSTTVGFLTGYEAKLKNIGGEIIVKII